MFLLNVYRDDNDITKDNWKTYNDSVYIYNIVCVCVLLIKSNFIRCYIAILRILLMIYPHSVSLF